MRSVLASLYLDNTVRCLCDFKCGPYLLVSVINQVVDDSRTESGLKAINKAISSILAGFRLNLTEPSADGMSDARYR